MKKALITGAGGMDFSYLSELLLSKGYKVFGTYRPVDNLENIKHIKDKIVLLQADLSDFNSILNAVKEADPDEVYNLASQSFVPVSWEQPVMTSDITGLGVIRILQAIKNYNPLIRFYQASSSELFGKCPVVPQNEKTPFHPRSPYGVAKLFGYWATINFRESFNMHASNGICFNHEGTRRASLFVTRKITQSIARIKKGQQDHLSIGNLYAKRDWSYAGDVVQAMWLMLQQEKPDDYVIASGETHTVKEFIETAFKIADMPIEWKGEGLNEVGLYNGNIVVKVDPRFYRPAEVDLLCGDYSKAKAMLGWEPKTSFFELVKLMMEHDLKG